MPPKFKVGDRVKCKNVIGMEDVLTLGQEYTVMKVETWSYECGGEDYDGQYLVFEEDKDKSCGGFARRFELVTTGGYNAPKFKVGDMVKVVARVAQEDGWHNCWQYSMDHAVGKVYKVKKVDPSRGVVFDTEDQDVSGYCFPPSSLVLVTASSTDQYNAPGQGIKHDQGKAQWHLVPLHYLEGMVKVMMAGAVKYSLHQWRAGMPHSQPYNALQRHLAAYQSGQDNDPETGLPHLDHALCCLLFLKAFTVDYPDKDDRYVPKS